MSRRVETHSAPPRVSCGWRSIVSSSAVMGLVAQPGRSGSYTPILNWLQYAGR